VILGHFWPQTGEAMKPFGDAFIKLIKMIIAPIIFCTVVTGIAGMEDMKKVGRVGGKALLYFEVVSTIALIIGLIIVNTIRPGAGFNADLSTLNTKDIASYTTAAKSQGTVEFLMNVIPSTVIDAFAKGEILQVLLFSVLFGLALSSAGQKGKPVVRFIDEFAHALFIVVGFIMRAAPVGAFGAMAFTIGRYGPSALDALLNLILTFYATAALFVFVILGGIARMAGFSILSFIRYIREELLIVLGTSSSESACRF
jgi:aerobic C4-dicarboxylate transport protein